MPIICFEGASAVGKTTVSAHLRQNYNAVVVPEVNLLFERKANEPQFWYFERQIERWQMAINASKDYQIVILDGDPFQPLWYNWSYDYDFGEPLESITDFYRSQLAAGKIAFPDKYFILTVGTDELKNRKSNDKTRTRKNFERHLHFIEPQLAYFNFIKSNNHNLVDFVENREPEKTCEQIINSINVNSLNQDSSLVLFDAIKIWLENNSPQNFKSLK